MPAFTIVHFLNLFTLDHTTKYFRTIDEARKFISSYSLSSHYIVYATRCGDIIAFKGNVDCSKLLI